ncbi:LamG-like jellyroll fold domain-containing protein [Pelagicoccus albus]|uniref:Staphylococcus aureus surface protein A n=1 Tax=Pelagicoccus albus TaxID=415222 RepID=A0A7X1B4Y4_9BACT|nr:LamG-like jellyroll fold domain-containing protein [Pelagicoccus albus]MBC2605612.1 hypothetical protein [Pelagicoccus albus]
MKYLAFVYLASLLTAFSWSTGSIKRVKVNYSDDGERVYSNWYYTDFEISRDSGTRLSIIVETYESLVEVATATHVDTLGNTQNVNSASFDEDFGYYYYFLYGVASDEPAGKTTVTVKPNGAVGYESESLTITVKDKRPSAPNLEIADFELNNSATVPEELNVGDRVRLSCRVENSGSSDSSSSVLEYYISERAGNTSQTFSDYIGDDSVSALSSGEKSSRESIYYTVTSKDVGDRYFILAIDPDNEIAETNDDDNEFTTAKIKIVPNVPTPPDEPILLAPGDGEIAVDLEAQRLTWRTADLAENYDVYFGVSPDIDVVGSNVTVNYWDLPALQGDTLYGWKVVAKNDDGEAASETWEFRTVKGESATPTLVPAGLSLSSVNFYPGETITVNYGIDNPGPEREIGLGFSLQYVDSDVLLNDSSNDTTVTVPGYASSVVSRIFVVPEDAESGDLMGVWGLWSDTPGNGQQFGILSHGRYTVGDRKEGLVFIIKDGNGEDYGFYASVKDPYRLADLNFEGNEFYDIIKSFYLTRDPLDPEDVISKEDYVANGLDELLYSITRKYENTVWFPYEGNRVEYAGGLSLTPASYYKVLFDLRWKDDSFRRRSYIDSLRTILAFDGMPAGTEVIEIRGENDGEGIMLPEVSPGLRDGVSSAYNACLDLLESEGIDPSSFLGFDVNYGLLPITEGGVELTKVFYSINKVITNLPKAAEKLKLYKIKNWDKIKRFSGLYEIVGTAFKLGNVSARIRSELILRSYLLTSEDAERRLSILKTAYYYCKGNADQYDPVLLEAIQAVELELQDSSLDLYDHVKVILAEVLLNGSGDSLDLLMDGMLNKKMLGYVSGFLNGATGDFFKNIFEKVSRRRVVSYLETVKDGVVFYQKETGVRTRLASYMTIFSMMTEYEKSFGYYAPSGSDLVYDVERIELVDSVSRMLGYLDYSLLMQYLEYYKVIASDWMAHGVDLFFGIMKYHTDGGAGVVMPIVDIAWDALKVGVYRLNESIFVQMRDMVSVRLAYLSGRFSDLSVVKKFYEERYLDSSDANPDIVGNVMTDLVLYPMPDVSVVAPGLVRLPMIVGGIDSGAPLLFTSNSDYITFEGRELVLEIPESVDVGTISVTITATGDDGMQASVFWEVNVIEEITNSAPSFEDIDIGLLTVGESYSFEIDYWDEDPVGVEIDVITEVTWISVDASDRLVIMPPVDADEGFYKAIIQAVDNEGLESNMILNFYVKTVSKPYVVISTDGQVTDRDGDGYERVLFDGSQSYDLDGEIVSYKWTVNNNEEIFGIEVELNLQLGVNNVVLTVTDDDGNTGTDTVTITVEEIENQSPVFVGIDVYNVGDDDGDGYETIVFDVADSYDPEGGELEFYWEIDGETFTGPSASWTFPVGSGLVILTLRDKSGATAIQDLAIEVHPSTTEVAEHYPLDGNGLTEDSTARNLIEYDIVPSNGLDGLEGNGVYFNGSSSYLELSDPILLPTDPYSVSVWIKIDEGVDLQNARFSIFNQGGAAGEGARSPGLEYYDGLWRFHHYDTEVRMIQADASAVVAGEWMHLLATWNEEGYLELFVDGARVAKSEEPVSFGQELPNFYLGGNVAYGREFFKGTMDELRIYNRELSLGEIHGLAGLKKGLVEIYALDGNGLATVSGTRDLVGTAISSTEDRHGVAGGAVSFNGSSSVLRLKSGLLDGSDEYTVSLWAKIDADVNLSNTRFSLFNQGSYPGGNARSPGLEFYNGTLRYHHFDDALEMLVVDTPGIVNGEWFNVTAVWAADGHLELWLDGVLIGRSESPIGFGQELNNFYLGANGGFESDYFKGAMDEVRIYHRALSADEIQTLASKTLGFAPIADAGEDQVLSVLGCRGTNYVDLDATGSFDLDGRIVSYEWFLGSEQVAVGSNAVAALMTGPNVLTLVVADDDGNENSDTVTYTLLDTPNENPRIHLSDLLGLSEGSFIYAYDMDGNGSETVTIDASKSFDPDGSILNYTWSIDGRSDVSGNYDDSFTAEFDAGDTTVKLTLTDECLGEAMATFVVRVLSFSVDQDGVIASFELDGDGEDAGSGSFDMEEIATAATASRFEQSGEAIYLNGDSSYLRSKKPILNSAEPYAISLWLKADSGVELADSRMSIFNQGSDPGGQARSPGLELAWGRWRFHHWTGELHMIEAAASNDVVENWTHLVAMWTEAGFLELWINGERLARSLTPIEFGQELGNFYLGANPAFNADFFQGSMDELRIYQRELSTDEIVALAAESGEEDEEEADPKPNLQNFILANKASSTDTTSVVFEYLSADGVAEEFRISEDPEFEGVSWQGIASSNVFTLSEGNGIKKVYFQLRNAYGESNVLSDTIQLDELMPPGLVQNIAATDGDYPDRVIVSWSSTDSAATYTVYRAVAQSESMTLIASGIEGNEIEDTDIEPGQTYTYWAIALNEAGQSDVTESDSGFALVKDLSSPVLLISPLEKGRYKLIAFGDASASGYLIQTSHDLVNWQSLDVGVIQLSEESAYEYQLPDLSETPIFFRIIEN